MRLYDRQLHTIGNLSKRVDDSLYAVVTVVREKDSTNTATISNTSDTRNDKAVKGWDLVDTE